jgi:hypothetical protein
MTCGCAAKAFVHRAADQRDRIGIFTRLREQPKGGPGLSSAPVCFGAPVVYRSRWYKPPGNRLTVPSSSSANSMAEATSAVKPLAAQIESRSIGS